MSPLPGDLAKGSEIGKTTGRNSGRLYNWQACIKCGYQRWVLNQTVIKSNHTGLCASCASRIKNRKENGHGNRWNGGIQRDPEGYVYIWVPKEDFFRPMANKRGYVAEHRLVMAKHLKRCLLPWEVVHHKGTKFPGESKENKGDNRLENLELLSSQKIHLVDLKTKGYIKRLENRVRNLEARITILEAENLLLRREENKCP